MLAWEVTEDPREDDLSLIAEGVFTFGRAQAAGGNACAVACFVRDGETVVAGASGRTEFDRLFVSHVWVSESLRGQGLGAKLLATLEDHAVQHGCSTAMIETLLEPAARMYESRGYEVIVKVPGYVGPFTRYIMLKQLNARTASSGA